MQRLKTQTENQTADIVTTKKMGWKGYAAIGLVATGILAPTIGIGSAAAVKYCDLDYMTYSSNNCRYYKPVANKVVNFYNIVFDHVNYALGAYGG